MTMLPKEPKLPSCRLEVQRNFYAVQKTINTPPSSKTRRLQSVNVIIDESAYGRNSFSLNIKFKLDGTTHWIIAPT